MSDEKSQQQTSTESTVAGAAKTGKAISNIAKGAAAGGFVAVGFHGLAHIRRVWPRAR